MNSGILPAGEGKAAWEVGDFLAGLRSGPWSAAAIMAAPAAITPTMSTHLDLICRTVDAPLR